MSVSVGGRVDRVAGWLRAHPVVVDGALGVIIALYVATKSLHVEEIVLLVVATVIVAFRRARPLQTGIALAVVGVAGVAVPGLDSLVIAPAALVVIYSLAAYGPRWSGPSAVVIATIAPNVRIPIMAALRGQVPPLDLVLVALGLAAALSTLAWLAGALRRAGRRHVEQLHERARLLEEQQEQRTQLATLAERTRISREMHDIIAHSLTVIVVQADGGRFAAASDPATAAAMFGDIAATGRSALSDVRSLLGLLRGGSEVEKSDGGTPQPGVGAIPTLVEATSQAGTPVTLSVTGERRQLPAGTELTAYRAVQEALTNTVKHAGPNAHAAVELAWHDDHLALHVTDDGPVTAIPNGSGAGSLGGHGLVGMRERVTAHGGTVDAAPRPGGGFGVHLNLPYRGST